ncbi:MAG: C39 family peptidase [bacterium]|nr:C39 family peptidase [bacterium]
MSILDVPLIRQPNYSVDCGIACIAMLLEYYNISYDYKKLRKEIGVFRYGTFMPQLGLYLLKYGFEVEIMTMHPALFTLFSKFENKQQLIDHLRKMRKGLPQKHENRGLDFFIKFIHSGGILTPCIPTFENIQQEIDHKRPLICSLTHGLLFKNNFKPKFNFHFNIVTGYDEKNIHVNDPDWVDDFGGKHAHTIHEYLYAMYANVYGFIDGSSLMKVKKK